MLDFYKVLRVEAVLRLICGILSSPKKMGESNFPAWGIIFGISGGGDNVKKNWKREKHSWMSVTSSRLNPATLLKVKFLNECFSRFLNQRNGTKSRKASDI